uniref:sigma-70 family RNA polymerase sigma factor n=1 Tax=Allokutzneria sp. NRRL B-24872 TaxID=1137961 RepID=UPI001178AD6B
MNGDNWLLGQFEEERGRLRAVALRMLGSASEAEDAVQETWLRLSRAAVGEVRNLSGWLTTVVGRVCLDMLRSRASRREEPLDENVPRQVECGDPESQALQADSVGLALLVVLDTLGPAERLAFVLHDLFGVPFEAIASIVGRSPAAARQLASRARRRVRGSEQNGETDQAKGCLVS